jgi:hypothetical protein
MDIKKIVAEICPLTHAERARYIIEYLSVHNIPGKEHVFDRGKNICVTRQGIDLQKEIIFFAHYDISNQTREGANDNTSSVAVLLKVAEYLQTIEPELTVRLVFNDTEEILGALLMDQGNMQSIMEIITHVGSFNYLKHYARRKDVQAVFIVELSGIGDTIYLADKSGNVPCDPRLLGGLSEIAIEHGTQSITLPVFSSDMISVFTEKMPGVVLGAIPRYEAENYLAALENGDSNPPIPHVWKKMHTLQDTSFSIQEKALDLVYEYICRVIDNCSRFLIN